MNQVVGTLHAKYWVTIHGKSCLCRWTEYLCEIMKCDLRNYSTKTELQLRRSKQKTSILFI